MGSKIPTSKFSESKEIRWGLIKVSIYASISFPSSTPAKANQIKM
jgi:hypothetical protein